eukprot:scaffold100161_cov35-Attheya_sp.AAC.1
MKRSTARGTTFEIGIAADHPAWKDKMMSFMEQHQAVHPDVLEFCTMGDMPAAEAMSSHMKKRGGANEDMKARVQEHFDCLEKQRTQRASGKKTSIEGKHGFKESSRGLTGKDKILQSEDCSALADEIAIDTSWGVRFLFQAFSLRKIGKEWRLWPFAQPDMNNRQINIDKFPWDEDNPTAEQTIPAIFKNKSSGFSTQQVCSVPCITQPAQGHGALLLR